MINFSIIRQDPQVYARCHEILGLPAEVEWSDIQVEFGLNDVGTITLTLLPTGDQIASLAQLAITPNLNDCAEPSRSEVFHVSEGFRNGRYYCECGYTWLPSPDATENEFRCPRDTEPRQ